MKKTLLPWIGTTIMVGAAFTACTVGDPDENDIDIGDGDGDAMGGLGGDESGDGDSGDGDSGDGDGDGDGDGSGGAGGSTFVATSCDDFNGGCEELCEDDGDTVECSCFAGLKLGNDGRSCVSIEVLHLGSGLNAQAVTDHLTVEGYSVTTVDPFHEWDADFTPPENFDVVVLLQGAEYNVPLSDASDAALIDWVNAGGTLIRSEWAAYQVDQEGSDVASETDIDQYLPIESLAGDYEYGTTWTVTDPAHPLTAGLPGTWMNSGGGCSIGTTTADAVLVAESDLCGPALSYKEVGENGGVVVHINDDFGTDNAPGNPPDPQSLTVLVNAINYGVQ